MKLSSALGVSLSTIVLFFSAISASAQTCPGGSGCLDPTFGAGGNVTTSINFGTGASYGEGSAIQPDGKILVVAGGPNYPAGTGSDFYTLRYNTDGTLDSTFGSGGVVRVAFASGSAGATEVAVQADGKIIVAGGAPLPGAGTLGAIAVCRLNSDGSLDASFGATGRLQFGFTAGRRAFVRGLVIQPNGSIALAGADDIDFAFARLTPAGALDTSFNRTGKLIVANINSSDPVAGINALTIQPDGKLVGAGHRATRAQSGRDWAVIRVNANGTLDKTFGSGGSVYLDFNRLNDEANSVAIDSSNRIVVSGRAMTGTTQPNLMNYRVAVARFTSAGQLDKSFGTGGTAVVGITGFYNTSSAMTIQSDGKIVTAGEISNAYSPTYGNVDDVLLVRFNTNGSVDQSFGIGGFVSTDYNGLRDAANSINLQSDGRLVIVGSYSDENFISVARYLN